MFLLKMKLNHFNLDFEYNLIYRRYISFFNLVFQKKKIPFEKNVGIDTNFRLMFILNKSYLKVAQENTRRIPLLKSRKFVTVSDQE